VTIDWDQAVNAAEGGDCRHLLKLVPDVRAVITRDGELHPFCGALAARPLLIWRVAVALARRGNRELLALLVAYQGPVPEVVQSDVYRIILTPRQPSRMGRPSKITAPASAEIMRAATRLLSVDSGQFLTERVRTVKQLAGKWHTTERTISDHLAKHLTTPAASHRARTRKARKKST
jgi:hypothetical protein